MLGVKRLVFCVSRWTYPDFFSRYRVLMKKSDMTSADKKLVCKNLLETLIKVRRTSWSDVRDLVVLTR